MVDSSEGAGLITAIEESLSQVHTQSLDISFNELLDMKRSEELNIRPEYQRLVQWSEGARSRFIESLLLEMPVPPIYVIEEEDGKYLLIDGLQRISSYLHFRGELELDDEERPVKRGDMLELVDCDIVEELNGKTWKDLPTALQIRLKRAFVSVEVIRKGSDSRFKYHMFKRLNTGGEILSDQQVRNCTIRLLDNQFNDFIIKCSKEDDFCECIASLTRERKKRAEDQELVLRFFAFKNYRERFRHEVADFLTEYMEAVSEPEGALVFDYGEEERIFRKTFRIFNRTLNDRSFCYASSRRPDRLTRGFSIYHYEALTVGLQCVLDDIDENDESKIAALGEALERIKLDEEFRRITTGGGKNSPNLLGQRIGFVEDKLKESL